MTSLVRIVRVDFHNLENHRHKAISEKCVALFVAEGGASPSAWGKARKWFETQPPEKLYLGWDSQVYPQFKVVREAAE